MQDAVVVSCISLFMSRRCSDLLTTALQTTQHTSHEEQQPARRLRDVVGVMTRSLTKTTRRKRSRSCYAARTRDI